MSLILKAFQQTSARLSSLVNTEVICIKTQIILLTWLVPQWQMEPSTTVANGTGPCACCIQVHARE